MVLFCGVFPKKRRNCKAKNCRNRNYKPNTTNLNTFQNKYLILCIKVKKSRALWQRNWMKFNKL